MGQILTQPTKAGDQFGGGEKFEEKKPTSLQSNKNYTVTIQAKTL